METPPLTLTSCYFSWNRKRHNNVKNSYKLNTQFLWVGQWYFRGRSSEGHSSHSYVRVRYFEALFSKRVYCESGGSSWRQQLTSLPERIKNQVTGALKSKNPESPQSPSFPVLVDKMGHLSSTKIQTIGDPNPFLTEAEPTRLRGSKRWQGMVRFIPKREPLKGLEQREVTNPNPGLSCGGSSVPFVWDRVRTPDFWGFPHPKTNIDWRYVWHHVD